MMRVRFIISALVLIAGAAGCASRGAPNAPSASRSLTQLDALYSDAIRKSAVVTPADILELRPLAAGPDGRVTVTTWAGCGAEAGPNRCRSYVPGALTLKWDVWVVADEEISAACVAFRGHVDVKLTQLLGLPAPRRPIAPDGYERQFVTLSAPIASLFRPCTDPRVETTTCGTQLPASLPPNAPPDYYRWFTNQAMSSWRIPAGDAVPDGFPWTRLGYTYNWMPNAPSRYGVSEYVIPGSSRPTDVTVQSIRTVKDYCRIPS